MQCKLDSFSNQWEKGTFDEPYTIEAVEAAHLSTKKWEKVGFPHQIWRLSGNSIQLVPMNHCKGVTKTLRDCSTDAET